MSRTFTQRTEFRFLFLALAFVLALAALVAFPAGEAEAKPDAPTSSSWLQEGSNCGFTEPGATGKNVIFTFQPVNPVTGVDDGLAFVVCGNVNRDSNGSTSNWVFQLDDYGPITIHVSCSDTFSNGYGSSGGPQQSDGLKVITYSIDKYPSNADSCGTTYDPPPLTATLTLIKTVADNADLGYKIGDFDIVTEAPGLSGFSETDTDDEWKATATGLAPDTYAVDEEDIANWTEGSWDCGEAVVFGSGRSIAVEVPAGADVTCKITNTSTTSSPPPPPPPPPPSIQVEVAVVTTTTTVPPCEVLGLEHLAAGDDDCEEAVLPLIIEETLPETGADTDAVAMVAGLMLLMGGALVAGSHYRRGESFTVDRLN